MDSLIVLGCPFCLVILLSLVSLGILTIIVGIVYLRITAILQSLGTLSASGRVATLQSLAGLVRQSDFTH